jgi:hypothetical protein
MTEIKPNQGIIAVIIDSKKEFGTQESVKTRADGVQFAMIKVASKDGGFIVPALTLTNGGEKLEAGDVIIWVPKTYDKSLAEKLDNQKMDKRVGWIGFIAAKIAPEIDIFRNQLTIICRYD